MRQNIQRTEERGGHLDNIEYKAKRLQENADGFKRGANRKLKDLKWKNVRMWVWLTLGAIVIIAILIGLSSSTHRPSLAGNKTDDDCSCPLYQVMKACHNPRAGAFVGDSTFVIKPHWK